MREPRPKLTAQVLAQTVAVVAACGGDRAAAAARLGLTYYGLHARLKRAQAAGAGAGTPRLA